MGTVPSPYTPTAGDDATQARVLTWADAANYLLGNATSGGSKRPLVRLEQATPQSIPNNTETAVLFDTESVDYDNGHSTVTNTSRYTAATAGWVVVMGGVTWASNATGVRHATVRSNGTTVRAKEIRTATNGDFTIMTISALVFLNVGDYIEITCLQTSGGALSITNNFVGSWMALYWLSN